MAKKSDSGFGRLSRAWAPVFHSGALSQQVARAAANESQPAWSRFPDSGAIKGPTSEASIRVLIAASVGCGLALRLGRFEAYSFVSSASASREDLERQIRAQKPRLVLMDSTLAEGLGAPALRNLAGVLPSTQWMLLWDATSSRGLELAVACRARGGIEWQSSPELFIQALRTVLGGELWFPRQAMQSLYLSLVAASDYQDCRPSVLTCDNVTTLGSLTEREGQITALMRQGLTNQEIGARLGISINTVKKHVLHAYEKCGSSHRRQFKLE